MLLKYHLQLQILQLNATRKAVNLMKKANKKRKKAVITIKLFIAISTIFVLKTFKFATDISENLFEKKNRPHLSYLFFCHKQKTELLMLSYSKNVSALKFGIKKWK